VNKIQDSNKILEEAVNQKVSELADNLRKDIYNLVSQKVDKSIKSNTDKIRDFSQKQLSNMENIGYRYEENQDKFLKIQGFKHVMFWIFAGSWAIWALIHIYQLIIAFI